MGMISAGTANHDIRNMVQAISKILLKILLNTMSGVRIRLKARY